MRLGPLLLKDVLGRGGAGIVWRATHVEARVDVAVKLLRRADESRFLREVRTVASLKHAHVVAVLDWGRVPDEVAPDAAEGVGPGASWLAMELLSGGTLARAAPSLGWVDLADAIRSILSALAHAHARGVLHLDVKPANVLADDDGRWRLADFGISQGAEGESTGGTPAYMAPELRRRSNVGPWTDLYAVGVTAFELAAGGSPFPEDSVDHWAAVTAGRVLPFVPRIAVPAGFDVWLARAMAREPEQRFVHAVDAIESLDALGQAAESPADFTRSPLSEAPTFDFGSMVAAVGIVHEPAPASTVGTLHPRPPRPVPSEWFDPPPPPEPPAGLGLGLVGVRPAPLVGRSEVRARLWRAFQASVDAGRSSVVWLSGPVGSGRWGLAHGLATHVAELGLATAVVADGALLDAVGAVWRVDGAQSATARVAALLGLSPEDPALARWSAGEVPPDLQALRLSQVLATLAREGPVVCVVRRSTEVARRLADRLADEEDGGPILLVLPLDDSDELPDFGERVAVPPLTRSERAWLATRLIPLSEDAAFQLADAALGHEDVVRRLTHLAATGALRPGPGGYEILTRPAAADLTAAATAFRLGATSEERTAIALAAWLGEAVGEPIWSEVCAAFGVLASGTLIDRGFRAGVLTASAGGFVFAPGVRSVFRIDRPAGVERIAAVLLGAGQPLAAAALFEEAERYEAAVEPARSARARAWSLQLLSVAEAAAALEVRVQKALGRAREAADAQSWVVYLVMSAGRLAEAERLAAELSADVAGRGWHGTEGEVCHVRALLSGARGDRVAMSRFMDLAIPLAERGGRSQLAQQMRLTYYPACHPAQSAAALEGLDPSMHKPGEIDLQLAASAASLGRFAVAMEHNSRAIATRERAGLLAYDLPALVSLVCGETGAAEAMLRRCLNQQVDDRAFAALMVMMSLATCDVLSGRWVEATARVARARRIGRRIPVVQDVVAVLEVALEARVGDALSYGSALDRCSQALPRILGIRVRSLLPVLELATLAWAERGDGARAAATTAVVTSARKSLDRLGYVDGPELSEGPGSGLP